MYKIKSVNINPITSTFKNLIIINTAKSTKISRNTIPPRLIIKKLLFFLCTDFTYIKLNKIKFKIVIAPAYKIEKVSN